MGQRRFSVFTRTQAYQNYTLSQLQGYDYEELLDPDGVTFDDSDTGNDPNFSDGVSMDEDATSSFYDSVAAQILLIEGGNPVSNERWEFLEEYVGLYQIADVDNSGAVGVDDHGLVSNYGKGIGARYNLIGFGGGGLSSQVFEAEEWIRNYIDPHNTLGSQNITISRFDQNKWYTRYDDSNNFDSIGRALVGTDSIGYYGITDWWTSP